MAHLDRANPENLPLEPQLAAPAEWKIAFDQLLQCSGSTAKIKFGVSKSVGLYVHYPLNQVVVSEAYLKRFQSMPVSNAERKELMQFVLAHELSHFILDHAIRSVENQKSPFQSRSSVSIAADIARTRGEEQNAYIDEYNRQHEEVDGVALALLKRCSPGRQRWHHLLEVARGLR